MPPCALLESGPVQVVTPELQSKLPDVGTTIFTVMSALAAQHKALNLSQGFPDFDAPPELLDRVNYYLRNGYNQYPPMAGVAQLREAIAGLVQDLYGARVNANDEITVTAGATEALFCAISAAVRPGDEVIVFDPAYDSYEPVVRLQGGTTIHIPLQGADFHVDWNLVAGAVTERTRLIIINTPHNPTGAVWRDADIEALRAVIAERDIFILSDEVYEHMIFDGQPHLSMCRFEDLRERSFIVSSFGKTYHVTGWKVGYCVAPPALTTEFRRVHQFVTFTVNTPVQHALADFLTSTPRHYQELPSFYQSKRDLFCAALQGSRFELVPSSGTYFQLLNYSRISGEQDVALARRWTEEIGIASIPISVFYQNPEQHTQQVLRFCFAKDNATIERAAEILCSL